MSWERKTRMKCTNHSANILQTRHVFVEHTKKVSFSQDGQQGRKNCLNSFYVKPQTQINKLAHNHHQVNYNKKNNVSSRYSLVCFRLLSPKICIFYTWTVIILHCSAHYIWPSHRITLCNALSFFLPSIIFSSSPFELQTILRKKNICNK